MQRELVDVFVSLLLNIQEDSMQYLIAGLSPSAYRKKSRGMGVKKDRK